MLCGANTAAKRCRCTPCARRRLYPSTFSRSNFLSGGAASFSDARVPARLLAALGHRRSLAPGVENRRSLPKRPAQARTGARCPARAPCLRRRPAYSETGSQSMIANLRVSGAPCARAFASSRGRRRRMLTSALAADLEGEWTTTASMCSGLSGAPACSSAPCVQPSTGRVFALADIVVDGAKVSFFVVHDAAWDEEVRQNGGKAFRNTRRRHVHGHRAQRSRRARGHERARATKRS